MNELSAWMHRYRHAYEHSRDAMIELGLAALCFRASVFVYDRSAVFRPRDGRLFFTAGLILSGLGVVDTVHSLRMLAREPHTADRRAPGPPYYPAPG